MRIDGIAVGDIVKASIGGRPVYGEVVEIRDRVVYFDPLSRAAGWRHATANQVVGHWRKAGRRRGRAGGFGDEQSGAQSGQPAGESSEPPAHQPSQPPAHQPPQPPAQRPPEQSRKLPTEQLAFPVTP